MIEFIDNNFPRTLTGESRKEIESLFEFLLKADINYCLIADEVNYCFRSALNLIIYKM